LNKSRQFRCAHIGYNFGVAVVVWVEVDDWVEEVDVECVMLVEVDDGVEVDRLFGLEVEVEF